MINWEKKQTKERDFKWMKNRYKKEETRLNGFPRRLIELEEYM